MAHTMKRILALLIALLLALGTLALADDVDDGQDVDYEEWEDEPEVPEVEEFLYGDDEALTLEEAESLDPAQAFAPEPGMDYGSEVEASVTDEAALTVEAALDAAYLAANNSTLSSGNYKVTGNVQYDTRIVISGDVTLVLGENTTMTASKGIEVSQNNTLRIEAEGSDGSVGKLYAGTTDGSNTSCDERFSGIGCREGTSSAQLSSTAA